MALLAVVLAGGCSGQGQGWATCCTIGNNKHSLAASPWKASSKQPQQLQPSIDATKPHQAGFGAVQKSWVHLAPESRVLPQPQTCIVRIGDVPGSEGWDVAMLKSVGILFSGAVLQTPAVTLHALRGVLYVQQPVAMQQMKPKGAAARLPARRLGCCERSVSWGCS